MINKWIRCVEYFHHVYGSYIAKRGEGLDIKAKGPIIVRRNLRLRRDLVSEEYRELINAITDAQGYVGLMGSEPSEIPEKIKTEILDAITDLIYVLIGTALTFGFDLDGAFKEVQRSNMSKLDHGRPIKRPDGKILKGPDFSPPDLTPYI